MKNVVRPLTLVLMFVAAQTRAEKDILGEKPVSTPSTADSDDRKHSSTECRTYFVDSENGQDDESGLSADKAWQSLERVNSAELKPGDTVRFRCGGRWRGSLKPISGDATNSITYTSYGEGAKPLFLGSKSRNRPEDWVRVHEGVWATLPIRYRQGKKLLDLHHGAWRHHQEAGATVGVTVAEDGRTNRVACTRSGQKSNHIQLWGPEVSAEDAGWLGFTLRARSSVPFRLSGMDLCQAVSPWTRYATAVNACEIGAEWRDFQIIFQVIGPSDTGNLHMNLGGMLPNNAVFEFQPGGVFQVAPNIDDPLDVDVGSLILDHGKVIGWKKWSVQSLEKPYDFYYDGDSRRVFLKSKVNPATQHDSIECAMKRHVIDQSGTHHVSYDGLAVKYGAAHGFGGGNTHHLVIRNCDVSYIGGGHQLTKQDGIHVRYGNGIEFWAAASDHLVENCRIWEVYDAALTNQNQGSTVRQENIVYRNNLIWNCEYSFEYWNRPETSVTRNIRFVNNTCVNAGVVWSHAQRPDPNGSHLMFYTNTADTSDFKVEYNIFCQFSDWGSRYSSGWKPLPGMDRNLWFSEQGVMVHWFGKRVSSFRGYQMTTGLDAQSVFADPEFIDPDNSDYRLGPSSAAREIRADGGPIGAEWLWGSESKERDGPESV